METKRAVLSVVIFCELVVLIYHHGLNVCEKTFWKFFCEDGVFIIFMIGIVDVSKYIFGGGTCIFIIHLIYSFLGEFLNGKKEEKAE